VPCLVDAPAPAWEAWEAALDPIPLAETALQTIITESHLGQPEGWQLLTSNARWLGSLLSIARLELEATEIRALQAVLQRLRMQPRKRHADRAPSPQEAARAVRQLLDAIRKRQRY